MRGLIIIVLALVFASSALADTSAPLYGGYRYNGRPVCAKTATLSITATQVFPNENSHTAVWSGVFAAGSQDWVQAGVTSDAGVAWAYLEWSIKGQYKLIRLADTSTLRVGLVQHGKAWTLTVGARSATVKLGPQTRCFIGGESEDWGHRNVLRGTVTADGDTFAVAL